MKAKKILIQTIPYLFVALYAMKSEVELPQNIKLSISIT